MAAEEANAASTDRNDRGTDTTDTKPASDGVLAPGTSEGSGVADEAKGEGASGEVKLSWWEKILAAFS
jgi:hypothetical protein